MFKQALTYVMLIAFWALSAFTYTKDETKWTATLQLEGTQKPILLSSDAVYGGYNNFEKKFFFFGKNHMFTNMQDQDNAKIFRDLCVTNASGQFQFELNGVPAAEPQSKTIGYAGNILFKKKHSIQGQFGANKKGSRIRVQGDLKTLGFTLTPEAQKVMTGKFTLTFNTK